VHRLLDGACSSGRIRPSRIVTPIAGAIVQMRPCFFSAGQSCGPTRSKPRTPSRAASRHMSSKESVVSRPKLKRNRRLLDAAGARHRRRLGARRSGDSGRGNASQEITASDHLHRHARSAQSLRSCAFRREL
jgi:hypothetical protein